MITEQQYTEACRTKRECQEIINEYFRQQQDTFDARWKRLETGEQYFTDDELVYSAVCRCDRCKAGMAYPKTCGMNWQWNCSAVLTGRSEAPLGHTVLPFAFYEVTSELETKAYGETTRNK